MSHGVSVKLDANIERLVAIVGNAIDFWNACLYARRRID